MGWFIKYGGKMGLIIWGYCEDVVYWWKMFCLLSV